MKKKNDSPDVPGAQALVRGLDVLLAIGSAHTPPKFRDLQDALGTPKASLHRLLSALQSRQLVRLDPQTKQFTLGSKVLDLARTTLDQSPIIKACKPEVGRLARKFHSACCLYILDGDAVFVLDFDDPDASQSRVVRAWPRLPAHGSAPGFAILSALSPEQRAENHPDLTEEEEAQISLGRALGYCIEQAPDGQSRIAAPVIDGRGAAIAALCCVLENGAHRPEELHEIGRDVEDAAKRAAGNVEMSAAHDWPAAPKPTSFAPEARTIDLGRDFMGENPIWHPGQQKLYWLDILAPALRWYSPADGESGRTELPDLFGGIAFTDDDKMILAGRKGVFSFDPASASLNLLVHPERDKPDNRFNTASVDRDGALWAGTMTLDNRGGIGSLYRITSGLHAETKMARVCSPKNVAWSPDGSEIYFTQGKTSTLCAYRADNLKSAQKRVIVAASTEGGAPNGITVDRQGGIWVAMFGNWSVRRYLPDGTLDREIRLPVPMPTNLAFGGPEMRTLYVTSTYIRVPAGSLNEAPQSGTMIAIETEFDGMAARCFGSGKPLGEEE